MLKPAARVAALRHEATKEQISGPKNLDSMPRCTPNRSRDTKMAKSLNFSDQSKAKVRIGSVAWG